MSAPVEMSQQRVLVDVDEHVATVTLSRPEKHNALDTPMFEAIVLAAEQVAHAPAIRCVVLHGAGPSFCSGLDLASLMSVAGGIEAVIDELRGEVPNRFQKVAYDWMTLP